MLSDANQAGAARQAVDQLVAAWLVKEAALDEAARVVSAALALEAGAFGKINKRRTK